MSTSFTFGTTDIKTVATTGTEILINRIERPVMKPVTRHKVEIPGRAGSWDFGGGVARDFTITVQLTIAGGNSGQVMVCARAIETALEGKKALVFSDDATKTFQAQVYEMVMQEQLGVGSAVRATIVFECDA